MIVSKKIAAVAFGAVAALSFAAIGQDPGAAGSADQSRQIIIPGSFDWVQKSDVSALKEGVIEHIEFPVGYRVKKGDEIGYIHHELAELTVAKAKLAATNTGDIEKAEAQKKQATAVMARIQRLIIRGGKGYVSLDEQEKAEAELSVTEALVKVAKEGQKLAKADYDLASQALKEHKIIAPFDGVITDRMKNPGESVRSSEAVVRIGRTNKLRFVGWVPLETAFRIKGNEAVDVRPVIENADLPIEEKKFKGKITSVSREIVTIRAAEVQVFAEVDNPDDPDHPELELRQGMKAEMTIFLGNAPAKVARAKP